MASADLPEPVDVLAIGPHPDDVETCAGGLMLRMRDAGYRLAIVDLTRGEAASRGTPESRARESAAAAKRLRLVGRDNLGLPDGALEPTAEMTEPVVAAIRRWRPKLVIGPCPVDLHPDHVSGAQIVCRAYYLATIGKAPGGGLPAHRPDALVHYFGHKEPPPTFIVDVSSVWEEKMALIECYATQFGLDGAKGPATNLTSPEFRQRFATRFQYWGSRIGAEYGEPFFAERLVPVDDPVAAFRKRDSLVR